MTEPHNLDDVRRAYNLAPCTPHLALFESAVFCSQAEMTLVTHAACTTQRGDDLPASDALAMLFRTVVLLVLNAALHCPRAQKSGSGS